jgi:hypothetical protein
MVRRVSLAERGRIFGNEPRAYPFGMLEFDFIENRAITDTMLE